MNKKGSMFVSIIVFAAIIIMLLVMSPFLLKMWNSAIPAFQNNLGNQSAEAGKAVGYVRTTTINFWQSIVLFMFLILLIVLLVSSFMIDVSPFFVTIYIIDLVFFFALAPAVSPMLYQVYESTQFTQEVSQIPALEFIVMYFWQIMLAVALLSGVIIFVKIRFLPSGVRR